MSLLFIVTALSTASNSAAQSSPQTVLPAGLRQAPAAKCLGRRGPEGHFGIYRSDARQKGKVVLTFDDGPHIVHTKRVLNVLEQYQLPATFFLVGRAINSRTFHLVRRMLAEGHSLGSHSYDHDVRMAFHGAPDTVEYIRGQHEVTQILIELALLAESPDDFDQKYTRVFRRSKWKHLSAGMLRRQWPSYRERHLELLKSLGLAAGARPYPILYSRPPGGGPYLSPKLREAQKLYDVALQRLGFLNIMWHAGSGDTDSQRGKDYGFLVGNLRYASRRGGILLMHDGMRADALDHALGKMANDPDIDVVPLSEAVTEKFGCDERGLSRELSSLAQ